MHSIVERNRGSLLHVTSTLYVLPQAKWICSEFSEVVAGYNGHKYRHVARSGSSRLGYPMRPSQVLAVLNVSLAVSQGVL